MHLLLLSNSTIAGKPFLSFAKNHILNYLGNKGTLKGCFIPYAGVSINFDEYFALVKQAIDGSGHTIQSLHLAESKLELINQADFIMVGGGNTFHLLYLLQKQGLMAAIAKKVKNGTKYIGWSAGANLCCPSICTTNDMPIVYPQSFNALNIVPFQINPHYTNKTIKGHAGETRDARINEYLQVNNRSVVLGLPENCFFELKEGRLMYHGNKPCRIFRYGTEPVDLNETNNFQFLIQ